MKVARRLLAQSAIPCQIIERAQNTSVSAARNVGWRLARSEWIQFLDADDLLAPGKIALQAACAARMPQEVAVVYSNWQHLILRKGAWRRTGRVCSAFIDGDPLLRILQDFSFGYMGPALIRESFLERIGGFKEDLRLAEDLDLMLRLAMTGAWFRHATPDDPLFFYRTPATWHWRGTPRNIQAMRDALQCLRDVELHLRDHASGHLSDDEMTALARRYSRWERIYAEDDPETFKALMQWLTQLGMKRPTDLSRGIETLSKLVGYNKATRLRTAFRQQVVRSH